MIRERRTLLLGVLVVVLAATSWWLKQGIEEDRERGPRPPHIPDFWVERLSAVTTGPDGLPRRILNAESMRHFPDDESTELTRPELLLLEPGKPPWRVRSDSGWASPDGELVLLLGEVQIERKEAQGARPVRMVTRDLRVQPKDEYAETEQRVRVESGPSWVTSTGLKAWFREPVRIKLLADVRGHYEANP